METRLEPPIVAPRRGVVAPNEPNRLVDPYDPEDDDWARWFLDPASARPDNEAIAYVDAHKLFPDMASALATAAGPGHSIFLAGWSVDLLQELAPGNPRSALVAMLGAAAARGVQVLVLLNKFSPHVGAFAAFDNTQDAEILRASGVHVVHDDRLLSFPVPLIGPQPVQAHHQKLLVVSGAEGLVGFTGGVDVEANRLGVVDDVHVRVRGAAAEALHRAFTHRWADHGVGPQPVPPRPSTGLGPRKDHHVAVLRTYPNAPAHGWLKATPGQINSFAPTGERTYELQIAHAIAQSRELIYVEDQYMVHIGLAQALSRAPSSVLIVLVTNASESVEEELGPQVAWRRFEFLRVARSGGAQVFAFQAKRSRYVHSKVWLFDDRFAILGSANANRRGMSHDSEVGCGVHDGNRRREWRFAHELRMNLWSRQSKHPPIAHASPSGGLSLLLSAAVAGIIDLLAPKPARPLTGAEMAQWDTVVDPDGA